MTHDLLIKNGTIVDGTGAAQFRGDIAVSGGRITGVGKVDGSAAETIDARDVYASSADAYPTMKSLESQGVRFANSNALARPSLWAFSPSGDWRTWNWSKSRVDASEPFPWLGCLTNECEARQ